MFTLNSRMITKVKIDDINKNDMMIMIMMIMFRE